MKGHDRRKEDEVCMHKAKMICNDMAGSPPKGTSQKWKGKDQNIDQDG